MAGYRYSEARLLQISRPIPCMQKGSRCSRLDSVPACVVRISYCEAVRIARATPATKTKNPAMRISNKLEIQFTVLITTLSFRAARPFVLREDNVNRSKCRHLASKLIKWVGMPAPLCISSFISLFKTPWSLLVSFDRCKFSVERRCGHGPVRTRRASRIGVEI